MGFIHADACSRLNIRGLAAPGVVCVVNTDPVAILNINISADKNSGGAAATVAINQHVKRPRKPSQVAKLDIKCLRIDNRVLRDEIKAQLFWLAIPAGTVTLGQSAFRFSIARGGCSCLGLRVDRGKQHDDPAEQSSR